VVERMFAAWAARDVEALLGCVDPEVEWRTAADGQVYRGHEGAREFFERQMTAQRLDVPLQRVAQVGPGRVLAVGRLRLIRPGRGLSDSPGVWAFHVSDGRITRIEAYGSEIAALAALRAVAPV
jgi:ketosteroid isomerase-like protein